MDNLTLKDVEIEAKNLAIAELPKCYFRESLTSMVKDASVARVNVVAKRGGRGDDWAAYIGWPTLKDLKQEHVSDYTVHLCTRVVSVNQVLYYGDKLSESVAALIFPRWNEAFYYRS